MSSKGDEPIESVAEKNESIDSKVDDNKLVKNSASENQKSSNKATDNGLKGENEDKELRILELGCGNFKTLSLFSKTYLIIKN